MEATEPVEWKEWMLVCSKGERRREESFGSGCEVGTQTLSVAEDSKCRE